MKTRHALAVGLAMVLALISLPGPSAGAVSSAPGVPMSHGNNLETPLLLIENAGQWPDTARFQVWGSPAGAGTTWLAEGAIWISMAEAIPPASPAGEGVGGESVSGVNLKLTFPDSNPDARIEPFNPLTTTVSYFLGDDPAQWRSAAPVYGGVRYVDLYPGVDLVLDGRDRAWRFEPAAGAAIDQVRVQVEGADVTAWEGGVLRLSAAGHPLSITLPSAPFAYLARTSGDRTGVRPHTVQPRPLASPTARGGEGIADLLYSTFLGGSDMEASYAIVADTAGNTYLTGRTLSSNFPTIAGAFDPTFNGGTIDAFAVKLNSTGSALVYATFLGGNQQDWGYGIAVDAAGYAYVTGDTYSANFPTTAGAFDTSFNGIDDAYLVKINTLGTGLSYATFLGGAAGDMGRSIAVDAFGSAYLLGATGSAAFPTTPGAFDTGLSGAYDAFLAKFNALGNGLDYATFLGGTSDDDAGVAIALDGARSAYVAIATTSNDFPMPPGGFDPSYNGSYDAVIAKLDQTGSALIYATYLGGSAYDSGYAIAVDGTGSVAVAGTTSSSNFPATPGAFSPGYNGGDTDGFVAKLTPDGSALAYATFLGGGLSEEAAGIAVDSMGCVMVTGSTMSGNFPSTPGAYDTSYNSGRDAFVTRLHPSGASLVYSTFLGSTDSDSGAAIALGAMGNGILTGATSSNTFPTTSGAYDITFNGATDLFVAKLALGGPPSGTDFNGNGSFDVGDIVVMGDLWSQVAGPPYDQDGDGVITIVDIQQLAQWWEWPVP